MGHISHVLSTRAQVRTAASLGSPPFFFLIKEFSGVPSRHLGHFCVIPARFAAYVRMRDKSASPINMARPTTMNFTEAVAIATSSLWAHKLRSVLTLIGVVIGVAAVIAVVSLINGANHYVATKVFNLGADVFGVSKQPSIVTNVDDWIEFQKRKKLTTDDYEAIDRKSGVA